MPFFYAILHGKPGCKYTRHNSAIQNCELGGIVGIVCFDGDLEITKLTRDLGICFHDSFQ